MRLSRRACSILQRVGRKWQKYNATYVEDGGYYYYADGGFSAGVTESATAQCTTGYGSFAGPDGSGNYSGIGASNIKGDCASWYPGSHYFVNGNVVKSLYYFTSAQGKMVTKFQKSSYLAYKSGGYDFVMGSYIGAVLEKKTSDRPYKEIAKLGLIYEGYRVYGGVTHYFYSRSGYANYLVYALA